MKSSFFKDFIGLPQQLVAVNQVIKKYLDTTESQFSADVLKMFNENSKLIRPALVIISSAPNKKVKQKAIDLAAAIEIMHVASLIHDDIIDDAKIRRNQPSINHQYDAGYAVICGDYLFSKSFELIYETQDLKSISLMGNNVSKMVFGEVEQYLDKYNQEISIERYFAVIEKKSASFFATSLVLGARLANLKEEDINTLEKIGLKMGMLFQIQDDLLDFKSSEEIGKSSMSDIIRGVYSLPIIIALQNNNNFKNLVINNHNNLDFKDIFLALEQSNALVQTNDYVLKYYLDTKNLINTISISSLKDDLTKLLDLIYIRQK